MKTYPVKDFIKLIQDNPDTVKRIMFLNAGLFYIQPFDNLPIALSDCRPMGYNYYQTVNIPRIRSFLSYTTGWTNLIETDNGLKFVPSSKEDFNECYKQGLFRFAKSSLTNETIRVLTAFDCFRYKLTIEEANKKIIDAIKQSYPTFEAMAKRETEALIERAKNEVYDASKKKLNERFFDSSILFHAFTSRDSYLLYIDKAEKKLHYCGYLPKGVRIKAHYIAFMIDVRKVIEKMDLRKLNPEWQEINYLDKYAVSMTAVLRQVLENDEYKIAKTELIDKITGLFVPYVAPNPIKTEVQNVVAL